jgi:TnpA family transposase
MARLEDTAYPRLKSHPTPSDLAAAYTPTWDEVMLANTTTTGLRTRVCFLILLKTYQRLGYPVLLADVPAPIVSHIAQSVGVPSVPLSIAGYDTSGTRQRHLGAIRANLRVAPWGREARRGVLVALREAARTKNDLADLINAALDELVRQRYELPAFDTLHRAVVHVRAVVNQTLYQQVAGALPREARRQIGALFIADLTTRRTLWNDVKAEPDNPTRKHLKELLARQQWLASHNVGVAALTGVPPVKVRHLAAEAMTLDAARMASMEPFKRDMLATALLFVRAQQALDDLGTMFIRQMRRLHNDAKKAQAAYLAESAPRTDALVTTLRDVVVAHGQEGTIEERFAAMDALIAGHADVLIEECDLHLAHAGSNYYSFLWRFYRTHRATLFHLLRSLTLRSTTQDHSMEEAIRFLQEWEGRSGTWLPTIRRERQGDGGTRTTPLVDLSWIPDGWWRLVTGEQARSQYPEKVNRRHFETCAFSQILWDLNSGDLCIVGSDAFADYRSQQISWEEYQTKIATYSEVVGLPVDGPTFVAHLRNWLEDLAAATDRAFPANKSVRIEQNEPIITRPVAALSPEGLAELEALLAARMTPISVLNALGDTARWLGWPRFFGPISGFDARIDEPLPKYVAVVFCYGSNIGPAQFAKCYDGLDRRQIGYINQRHSTEETLDKTIGSVVNDCRRFSLPRCWGSATRVGADGTKWDIYEQNLLAEAHVRYGGYGGIGYYHVAGDYIALFSRFIPCGTYEGVFILDPFFAHQDDGLPEAVHSDTHGQSAPIFGLSYLLGIQLMPRIRNWKHLTWYRPSPDSHYEHIDALFTETADWQLIETHLPDMLRVVLSIKEGRFTPSTILRRLGTYSRKNRLYHAFCELGRVIRTGFLLRYLADAELRSTVHAAMNKNESWNQFLQWVAFAGDGMIAENDRLAQRKIIKYNHLLANCLLFYTIAEMTRVLGELRAEGYPISAEVAASLSPYTTGHYTRFGHYSLDLSRELKPLAYDAPILSTAPMQETPNMAPC